MQQCLFYLKALNEGSTQCPYVIGFIDGREEIPTHIITELPTKGDLLSYLQGNNAIKVRVLQKISLDVCCAMVFLAERGKQLIH